MSERSSEVAGLDPQGPAEASPETDGTDEQSTAPAVAPERSRRQALALGVAALAGAATLAAPEEAAAQHVVRPPTRRPPAPPAVGDSLLRLVRRVTNGLTEEEVARAKKLGFNRYLEYHLKPAAIDDSAVEQFMATNYPALALDASVLYAMDLNLLGTQLQEATMYRAAFSKRQLYERMVHFWSDHFNIYYPKVNYLQVIDDREVIRKHALGKFPDMLRASAHSPAMLEYLDNTRSRRGNINENYAREIMELHTLGVDGGYTQTDVRELARVLTGWTIAGRGQGFSFVPAQHDLTAKTVLGLNFPAAAQSPDGVKEGEQVLDLLVKHENTAKFVSTKMIRWLLRYDPPADLVAKVSATYTRTGGDIPSMIRDILTPQNLMAAPAKYRQPYQLVLAALRATQPTVNSIAAINRGLGTLGQSLFRWQDPDGYPDDVDWWAGTILQRWNFMTTITNLASGDIVVDVNPLMVGGTADFVVDAIGKRAFAGEMPAALKAEVRAFLAAGQINAARVREGFALALSSSSFQWF